MTDDPSNATTPATPRRRRAAGRPAGPPAPVEAAAAAPTAPEPPAATATETPTAAKATTKKAAKKAPAKKAAAAKAPPAAEADHPNQDLPAVAAPSAAPAPAKRTRSRKAVAVPAFSAVADTEPDVPVAEAPAAGLLMFQAPSAEAAPARRTRKAAAPAVAAPPVEEPEDEIEDETEADVEVDGDADADAATDGEGSPRRRRRRGGRGRRRRAGGPEDDERDDDAEDDAPRTSTRAATTQTTESATDVAPDAEADDEESEDDSDESGSGSSRRRRRRRRRTGGDGESDGGTDDPPNTVVRVREPRAKSSEVTSVKGSTRLEAKKQRRREGREAGRRRPSILTEAEFLARREAVDRVMVVRQREDRTQIAVLEDGVLVEHYVNRSTGASMIGNVYLGKVQNVLPSMEAAFVDIGRGRNAVLYAGEVNWDAAGLEGQPKRIEAALKPGDTLLVQVSKDPLGHKGARLTAQVSLPGRFLVYVPAGSMTGISRKLPDTERTRLKSILRQVLPEEAGVIVRTAAEGASEEELRRDVERLASQWEEIEKQVAKHKDSGTPTLLHGEPDLAIKVVRDIFNEDFGSLVVEGDEAWQTIESYVTGVAPDLADRIQKWVGPGDLFASYRIDEQLAKALDRKVWLPSGGSLVIDRTEAMTVVDVNTGKFIGSGGNLEATVTKNNIEAAEEIVRQLRLRDVGGIIVVDFIDMVLESNRDLVLRRLLECLGRDRTKHQVAEVTSLGLVQMTRKRIGQGLLEVFSEPCESCNGRGVHIHSEPVATPGTGAATESEGPATRSRKRKGAEPTSESGRGKGRAKGTSGTAKAVEVEPRVIDPAVSAAMEKVHAAAAKAAAAAGHDHDADGVADAGTPVDAPEATSTRSGETSVGEAAPASPAAAKRTRGPRKATRKAGPAAGDAAPEGADVTGATAG